MGHQKLSNPRLTALKKEHLKKNPAKSNFPFQARRQTMTQDHYLKLKKPWISIKDW